MLGATGATGEEGFELLAGVEEDPSNASKFSSLSATVAWVSCVELGGFVSISAMLLLQGHSFQERAQAHP
jgi:hypothetical protein